MLVSVSILCAEQSGSIGVAIDQVIDDRGGSIHGDYNYKNKRIDFEADGQLQAGNAYRGKLHTNIVFDIGAVGIKVAADNTAKGQTLDDLGRNQTLSLALNVPVWR